MRGRCSSTRELQLFELAASDPNRFSRPRIWYIDRHAFAVTGRVARESLDSALAYLHADKATTREFVMPAKTNKKFLVTTVRVSVSRHLGYWRLDCHDPLVGTPASVSWLHRSLAGALYHVCARVATGRLSVVRRACGDGFVWRRRVVIRSASPLWGYLANRYLTLRLRRRQRLRDVITRESSLAEARATLYLLHELCIP